MARRSSALERQGADALRIGTMLAELAAISDSTADEGVTRLGYTAREREAHDLVAGWAERLGFEVWGDSAGNTIAERAGRAGASAAIGTGSHLDSVPGGGRFDGVAGVVLAIEAARLVVEREVEHAHPLRIVVFACEEGARFGEACIGSKAVAGLWADRDLESMRDASGVTLAAAMRSVGLDPDRIGDARWEPQEWGAFIELHVEQGQVLENEQIEVGLVANVSGSARYELVIDGRSSHSGATPMALRADALTAAAEIVLAAEEIANDEHHRGTRCTVGRLEVTPGTLTTIPGHVLLTLDVRDIDADRLGRTAQELLAGAGRICDRRGLRLSIREFGQAAPVSLPSWIRQIVAGECARGGISYRVMDSGASHDAQIVNCVVPAGLVFMPSIDGLSHVPDEWSSSYGLARGAEALFLALLRLDAVVAVGRSG